MQSLSEVKYKSVDRIALDEACEWLAKTGACKYVSRDECDKKTGPNVVCAACLSKHFIWIARNAKEGAKRV